MKKKETRVKPLKIKSKVYWKWIGSEIHGHVVEIHFEPVIKTIKNKKIKRNGSPECPAYLVQSAAGNYALKLHSELYSEHAEPNTKMKPKMFG